MATGTCFLALDELWMMRSQTIAESQKRRTTDWPRLVAALAHKQMHQRERETGRRHHRPDDRDPIHLWKRLAPKTRM